MPDSKAPTKTIHSHATTKRNTKHKKSKHGQFALPHKKKIVGRWPVATREGGRVMRKMRAGGTQIRFLGCNVEKH